jgi:hypothetical protein
MLLAMLYYFLFATSGGDGIVADIAKPVKQYVQDEAKAEQVIAINKKMLSEEAALKEDIAKAREQIAKRNGNRLASEAEFTKIFAALDQKRADFFKKLVDSRFKMKELMTAEEWRSVHVMAGPEEH